jgi:hypothetical protein
VKATRVQIRVSEAIVAWYFRTHFGTPEDPGLPRMFFDHQRVGDFATTAERFAAGDSDALHRVLVAMIMFQRRQDVQIARILQGMDRSIAREIMAPRRLLALVDESPCSKLKRSELLHSACDLGKDLDGRGTCRSHPELECHLKRHTVALKRYGHFGKFPTSAALMLRELGLRGLGGLYARVLRDYESPTERAEQLEVALSRIWRVSHKIAAMFLSALTNPDIGSAPWSSGIDWSRFVVVDSNVDLFMASIGYEGNGTYEARRAFLIDIARKIDLAAFSSIVRPFNPRLVQQAMYLFMSSANRRVLAQDCMGAGKCASCARPLRQRCPVSNRPAAQTASSRDKARGS